ncbi:MAG TPA: Rne/Rng family ribonuclease [Candidatus Angelobacter sp.]|nr:Rne/Rng family ribonuclease [Candidatus Angelobacter sp.]
MSKELFVSSTPHETKVAVVEDDQLAEIYYERENEYTLAGSIYKGRVTRVLPGMQSAFVNIGLERDAFLYVSDFLLDEEEDAEGLDQVVSQSRPLVLGEAQEPSGEATPLEAEEVIPAELAEEEKAQPETGESEGERPRNEEQGHDGARKWRGRRRRGRGRGRFSDREERESPARPVEEVQTEAAPEPAHEERHERVHRGSGPDPALEPMVLPGESISKYGGSPAASESRPTQPQAPARSSRASTEYTINPGHFSPGSMVLPGESIAKYQHESAPVSSTTVVEPPAVPAQEEEDRFAQEGYARSVPEQLDRSEQKPRASEPAGAFATGEAEIKSGEADSEEGTSAQGQEEERFEQMNVASAFGNDKVVEEPEEEAREQRPVNEAEAGESRSSAENHETRFADQQQPWQASSRGLVEEEEIEEEESEIPGYEEDLDLAEFDELEEEVLGPGDERMFPMGSELTEAVRDAHVNERATGQYEGEEPDEHSEVEPEDEFAPPSALSRILEEQEEPELAADFEESEDAEDPEEPEGEEDLEGARAEHRATAGTAGYQQPQRSGRRADRRGGRRTGGRHIRGRKYQAPRQLPAISDLLKEGQEILVQIAKEPIAKKGARITSHIALPGRFLVYMPTVHHTGVSRKIGSEEERHRLKRIVLSERGDANGGFIVRTAAAGASEEDLRADIRFLINLWNEIRGRAEKAKAPALIYHDLNLVERILRDQVTSGFSAIWADTEQEYERVLRFVSRFQSSLVKRVKLYSKETPLFEQFNIADEINKALKSKVWLKSGGYIVINQTEALVAIDINTGKYVGKTARLEDTIVKTNIDAIKEIVRQIRLRDLGGIIVIDFIDMDERKNRQKVMQALEEALKADRAPSKVLQFNDFGLVAITRKRVKQSLERTLGQPCPTCQATGMIKSVTTVCNEIYVEMRKMARHFERDVMLRVNPEVAKALKANGGKWLQEMEELTKRTILVKSDPLLHPENFDIQ